MGGIFLNTGLHSYLVSNSNQTRVMLEKQDHIEITINNKQNENIKTNYSRDTSITWFTQDGICPHINFQSFIIISLSKIKGYNLQQPCYTSSSLSHILSHTITKIVLQCYNTIQYTTILQCFPFIGELPWENTTGHSIPWARK